MRKAALVIPCYNEALRLRPEVYIETLTAYSRLDFIFVDDGSSDGTSAALERIRASQPERVKVIIQPRNQGKAEAVRAGVLRAAAEGYPIAGYWDADHATPLRLAPRLIAAMEDAGAQMALGSRVRLLGRRVRRSLARHYLGRIFATAVSLILDMNVYDTQCGAKVFLLNDVILSAFAKPFASRWVFDVELLARIALAFAREGGDGLETKIIEYPLEEWTDVAGSNLRPAHYFLAAHDVFMIALRYAASLRRFRS